MSLAATPMAFVVVYITRPAGTDCVKVATTVPAVSISFSVTLIATSVVFVKPYDVKKPENVLQRVLNKVVSLALIV